MNCTLKSGHFGLRLHIGYHKEGSASNLKTMGKKGYKISITYFQFVQRSYTDIFTFEVPPTL